MLRESLLVLLPSNPASYHHRQPSLAVVPCASPRGDPPWLHGAPHSENVCGVVHAPATAAGPLHSEHLPPSPIQHLSLFPRPGAPPIPDQFDAGGYSRSLRFFVADGPGLRVERPGQVRHPGGARTIAAHTLALSMCTPWMFVRSRFIGPSEFFVGEVGHPLGVWGECEG